eukprot:1642359-Amphidinium_carterae.1
MVHIRSTWPQPLPTEVLGHNESHCNEMRKQIQVNLQLFLEPYEMIRSAIDKLARTSAAVSA